jgi:hypothetical protein
MAGLRVCGSKRLASNIRKGRKITIHSVNGKLTTDIWCDLLDSRRVPTYLMRRTLSHWQLHVLQERKYDCLRPPGKRSNASQTRERSNVSQSRDNSR